MLARVASSCGGVYRRQSNAASVFFNFVRVGDAIHWVAVSRTNLLSWASRKRLHNQRAAHMSANLSCKLARGVVRVQFQFAGVSNISPVSKPASICMMTTPVFLSPASIAR